MEIIRIIHGSRLYGTASLTSDYDVKVIHLPCIEKLLLAIPLEVKRERLNAEGVHLKEGETTPPSGYDFEHIPVQKFIKDYLSGQAYAFELAFAVPTEYDDGNNSDAFIQLCKKLVIDFAHKNIKGMIGFAEKQVHDYCDRGERYTKGCEILEVIDLLNIDIEKTRLETPLYVFRARKYSDDISAPLINTTLLDIIGSKFNLEIGLSEQTKNGNKLRFIKINGKEFIESMSIENFRTSIQKQIHKYGERVKNAAENKIDWKSLSHAVRVYEEVIEYFKTNKISFPRPNIDELIKIKNGLYEFECMKMKLQEHKNETTELFNSSKLPEVTPEFSSEVNEYFCNWLKEQYKIKSKI